ncbi:MAG TPA: isocitrate lyase/PEP mutase family protein [Vicinamibacteria bacterium]|nr:isocitrate lyase/PEP mutase family protein [Vicinamibacteria bacterium]
MSSPASVLRSLLQEPGLLSFPCCYDALSARLIERAGFPLSFMSGFGVSAVRLGLPDTGLVSYAEMLSQGRDLCAAVSIPIIGDGDTGYGNAVNVKRTVRGYARAGFAAVMIEDQVWPKRCGHTRGKSVVSREEAVSRVRAAVDARDEGADILIMARTDARATEGLEEALCRAEAFSQAGADMLFVEAPTSREEMRAVCRRVPGHHLANMLEDGVTPICPEKELEDMGYKLVAHPFALLGASLIAMKRALEALRHGRAPAERISFEELKELVGFEEYYREEKRYTVSRE